MDLIKVYNQRRHNEIIGERIKMKTIQIAREEIGIFEIWSSYIDHKGNIVEFQDRDTEMEIFKNGKFNENDFYSLTDDCNCEFRKSCNGRIIESFESLKEMIRINRIDESVYMEMYI